MQSEYCAPVQKFGIDLKLEHTFALLSQQFFYLLNFFGKVIDRMMKIITV